MRCIKRNDKKYYDVAVIFERKKNIEGLPTLYKPLYVRPGNFDKNSRIFTDIDGIDYYHMSNINEGKIGFGLRTSLQEIYEIYGKKNLKNCVRAFYNEIRFDTFSFGTDSSNMNRIYLIGENNITHSQAFYDEEDVIVQILASNRINTKKIINTVKKKVIGQNDAIDDIVTVLWQNSHSKNRKNLLLIGPTGVGKTEIIKTISKELNIPLVIASASGLTKSGYKGESVEDILRRLLNKANGDVSKAETGIIVLDEFDKLACRASLEDTISTSGVQEELLKFTEGCEYELNVSTNPMYEEYVPINTEGITFIAMGAFADLDRQNNTKVSNSIGFGSRVEEKKDSNSFYKEISSDDLIKYGLIAELVGRFPIVIPLNPITEDILVKIMDNPNNGLFDDKIKLLSDAGIKLNISNPEAVKRKIAHYAIEKNIGVRGLNSVVERTFVKAMREVSQSNGEYDELIIDENTVDDPKKFVLKKKNK